MNEPFTLSLSRVFGETWENYALRCHDIANYAIKQNAHLGQPEVFDPSDTSRYRKISEGAYELITPGYQPPVQQEPRSERERHFQGFAQMLWDESHTLYSYEVDLEQYGKKDTRIIARRDYDLVCHTIDALWPYMNDGAIEPSASSIPDMTEFPESEEE